MLLKGTFVRGLALGLGLMAALVVGSGRAEATVCEDCEGTGDGGSGGTPKPIVPMISIQLDFCLSGLHLPGLNEQTLVQPLKDGVQSAFSAMRAALDVKATPAAEMNRIDH